MMPLAMIIFGDATGLIVDYVTTVSAKNITEAVRQTEDETIMLQITKFAITMSLIGAASIAATYISNTLLTYTASRQVSELQVEFRVLIYTTDTGIYSVKCSSNNTSNT